MTWDFSQGSGLPAGEARSKRCSGAEGRPHTIKNDKSINNSNNNSDNNNVKT
jgi:hypothetical protein